jgi:hypothetical protein
VLSKVREAPVHSIENRPDRRGIRRLAGKSGAEQLILVRRIDVYERDDCDIVATDTSD